MKPFLRVGASLCRLLNVNIVAETRENRITFNSEQNQKALGRAHTTAKARLFRLRIFPQNRRCYFPYHIGNIPCKLR